MKNIKLIGFVLLLLGSYSCKDFDEMQIDPNKPTEVSPALLLTYLEQNTFNVNDVGAALASRMLVFTDGTDDNQYYGWQRSSYYRYNNLRQVVKMNQEAERTGLTNYKYLGLFFQSVQIIEITRVFGDVPYSESLAGTTFTPAYDPQEDIYIKVLDDLKAANAGLSTDNGVITGDIIYGGDITKWKKLINSFSLRVLMSLSNKTGNSTLNVEGRFNEIVGDPATFPLMESNADNGALVFNEMAGNRYPFFNNNNFKTAYYMEESFINLLKGNDDPRLFVLADKNPNGSALPATDPDAYGGLDGSAPLADNTTRVVNGEASRTAPRFYNDQINEPAVLLGYAELEFTLAEAAARGWTTDDPETHYLNGIRASMDFYGISTSDQDAYVLEAGVVYSAPDAIEQIVTQKYLNYFLNGGWEPFFNNQRTGFPVFSTDGGGVLNNEIIPKRWMYPQEEFTLNLDNIQAAIDRQFPSGDDVNEVMWLQQPE